MVVPTALALGAARAASAAARARGVDTEANPTAIRCPCRTGTYSIEKARRVLGAEPVVDLAGAVARTKNWRVVQGLVSG